MAVANGRRCGSLTMEMNVFRHHDVTDHHQLIAPSYLFQDAEK